MPRPQTGPSNEDVQNAVLLQEREYDGLPSGFRTNFRDEERLEEFVNILSGGQSVNEAVTGNIDGALDGTTRTIPGGDSMREVDEIDWVLDRVVSSYITPERTIQIPGIELNRNLIKAAAVSYKRDTDTPSGTIKPPEHATNDDIVFEFVTPETYSQIGTGTAGRYIRTGLTDDSTIEVVGTNGIDGGGSAAFTDFAASDWIFYTGDVIDPLNDARITKYQWLDVNGDTNIGPTPSFFGRSVSSVHMQLITGELAKDSVRLQGKVYDAGTAQEAEPVPVAFRFADGADAQALQD